MSEMDEHYFLFELLIVFPEDETRGRQLQEKLKEYKARLSPYRAPELQMGTICKIAILEELSEYKFVDAQTIRAEMIKVYGSGFDEYKFKIACYVIDNYCKTGGEGNVGGTGLPNVDV